MKIQVFVLIILLWVTGRISAQEINCEIQSPVVNVRQDSLVISWHMLVSVPDLETRGHVTLTPILSGQGTANGIALYTGQWEKGSFDVQTRTDVTEAQKVGRGYRSVCGYKS